MKMLTKLLQACIAIEILGAAFFVVVWLRDPVPPRSNLAHYHPATADEIRSLEETVRDSGAAENWLTLGKAYLAAGFFPHGEYCCEQAARDADSDDAASFETLYWWGVALNQLGDTSQAIERFRQALPFADDHTSVNDAPARCWYGIGRNLLRQEDAANAEAAFRKAGNYLPARCQLVRILVRANRGSEAIPILDELVSGHPNESTFYQLRARAREQTGDTAGAFDDRTHVERAPDRLRSDSIIAELQYEFGAIGLNRQLGNCSRLAVKQPQQAATSLRELLSAEWRAELAVTLVEAEMRIGNAQQAVDLLNEFMQRGGTTPERLAQLAYGHRWLGQDEMSFKLLQRAAELMHIESVHDGLSQAYLTRGENELSDQHRALASMTGGIAAFRENRLLDASTQLQRALLLDPELSNGWFYLAECYRVQGQVEDAIDALRKCLQFDQNHGRARSRLLRLSGSNPEDQPAGQDRDRQKPALIIPPGR
ncbi:MAG: tetratricopeptide repeat protein [Planctomycetales bacterium]